MLGLRSKQDVENPSGIFDILTIQNVMVTSCHPQAQSLPSLRTKYIDNQNTLLHYFFSRRHGMLSLASGIFCKHVIIFSILIQHPGENK